MRAPSRGATRKRSEITKDNFDALHSSPLLTLALEPSGVSGWEKQDAQLARRKISASFSHAAANRYLSSGL